VAFQAGPPFGPAGVLLAFGAGVARVLAHLVPQRQQLVVLAGAARGAARPTADALLVGDLAHGGGQVPPLLRGPVVEVLRHPYAGQRHHRRRELARRDPAGPPILREHEWLRFAEPPGT